MPSTSLTDLSTEVLRQICGHLPCKSSLTFLLTCRSIYSACNDWTVWRNVIIHSDQFPCGGPVTGSDSSDSWKRYVIAATKATRTERKLYTKDLEEWLTQMAASGCPYFLQGDLSPLLPICHEAFDILVSEADLKTATSKLDTSAWRLAQAAGFCLTMQYLSMNDCINASKALKAMPWPRVPDHNQYELSVAEREKIVIIQHALANRAVGFCCATIRYALVKGRTLSRSSVGLSAPPEATTIPFPIFMKLPLPFGPDLLEIFGKCHLAEMTEPSFFLDDEWTGYIVCTRGWANADVDGIGGRHYDAFTPGDGCSILPGHFAYDRSFESVVRFRLIEEYSSHRYRIQSNDFHSQANLHNITITVERDIGRLVMKHWYPLGPGFSLTDGVITPFGIVSELVPGIWMWLWKTKWSDLRPELPQYCGMDRMFENSWLRMARDDVRERQ